MSSGTMPVWIGTAGWSIPRKAASRFDTAGTHLERYSAQLCCAEINSSFYRAHSATTYAKWRNSTPPNFRFAVKMPRVITHDLKLHHAREPLAAFLAQTDALADKRGPLLLQLPPSLSFDPAVAMSFLSLLRDLHAGPIVCEPRHASWFEPTGSSMLERYRIARVAADPPPVPGAMSPGGWPRLAYFRLHGSPRKYWSPYEQPAIAALAATVGSIPGAEEVWYIFDNTASGAAIDNAWDLRQAIGATVALAPTDQD